MQDAVDVDVHLLIAPYAPPAETPPIARLTRRLTVGWRWLKLAVFGGLAEQRRNWGSGPGAAERPGAIGSGA